MTNEYADWERWRSARADQLRDPHGPLSFRSLHWLGEQAEAYPPIPGKWSAGPAGVTVDSADGLLADGLPLVGSVTLLISLYLQWANDTVKAPPCQASPAECLLNLYSSGVAQHCFADVESVIARVRDGGEDGQLAQGDKQVLDRLRFLHLGDHRDPPAFGIHDFMHCLDVIGAAHE